MQGSIEASTNSLLCPLPALPPQEDLELALQAQGGELAEAGQQASEASKRHSAALEEASRALDAARAEGAAKLQAKEGELEALRAELQVGMLGCSWGSAVARVLAPSDLFDLPARLLNSMDLPKHTNKHRASSMTPWRPTWV